MNFGLVKSFVSVGVITAVVVSSIKLYNKLKSKIFYSTDASNIIGDVLWYGHTGILPKSAINFLPRGYNKEGINWIEISSNLYSPLKQGFVISKKGIDNIITKRFIKFLLGDGQKILNQNGYE